MSNKDHQQSEKMGILERKVIYSKLALFTERVWPALWPPIATVGIFILISLTGVWMHLPEWAHKLGLSLLGLLFIVSFVPLLMCRWPGRKEALLRIERVSGLKHNPVSSYEDTLGSTNPSRATLQLWQAHRKRLSETFDRLKAGFPRPRVDKLDPLALRSLLAILLLIGILATGNLAYDRISSAFKIASAANSNTIRLDAWITPPSYTQKAPIIVNDGSKTDGEAETQKRFIQIPENSVLVIRLNSSTTKNYTILKSDKINYGFRKNHAYSKLEPDEKQVADSKNISQYRIPLSKSISIKIQDGLKDVRSWQIFVQEDLPPTIKLHRPIRVTARNSLHLTYSLSDDYGIKSAIAKISRPGLPWISRFIPFMADPPLGEAPVFNLQFPGNTKEKVTGTTYKDLTSHPWAGLKVMLTLSAKDEASQEASSKTVTIRLPSRKFKNNLAKALIEQRQQLVSSPKRNRALVMRALWALTLAPEQYIEDVRIYLGIRTAFWRLRHNTDRASARSVADQLWYLALYIEDGDLFEAERQLKLAQDQLSKSLREGAPGEVIRKQLQELRNAIARFTQALAKQQKNNPTSKQFQEAASKKVVSAQDLDRMLRKIERLAKSGAREQAAQMLNNLRNVLENIEANTAQQTENNKEMMSAFDKLNEVATRQQKLLDETFTQKQNAPLVGGPKSKAFDQNNQKLEKQQQSLSTMLSDLMQGLKNQGVAPNPSLNQALQAMKESSQSINQRNLDKATQQQTLALDKLRKGTQRFARMLMQQLGQAAGRQAGQRDPFGRQQGSRFGDGRVKNLDKVNVERAREILQELRKRYGNSKRPPVELDYLERLLKRF